MAKKNFTFRLLEELVKRLDTEAEKQRRSRTNLLELIVHEYLKQREH